MFGQNPRIKEYKLWESCDPLSDDYETTCRLVMKQIVNDLRDGYVVIAKINEEYAYIMRLVKSYIVAISGCATRLLGINDIVEILEKNGIYCDVVEKVPKLFNDNEPKQVIYAYGNIEKIVNVVLGE